MDLALRAGMRSLAATVIATLFACSAAGTAKAPGAEEGALGGGKSDSFINPSNMGEVAFGVANRAAFTDAEQFLSWQFRLESEAHFSLAVDAHTANLDTVMYLYHRANSEDSWGPYVEKNDDYEEQLWSRIDFDGEPGEYRLIIKPYKLSIRGTFDLRGECDGDGCPSASSCDEDELIAPLPQSTGFSPTCAAAAIAALDAAVTIKTQREVTAAERCNLNETERRGIEHYMAYWDEIGYPELYESYDPDEPTHFAITRVRLTNGTELVSVDVKADEDNVTFVYDSAGELVLLFHSEQSSSAMWYCAAPGDEISYFEDKYQYDCVGQLIWGMPRGESQSESAGQGTVAEILGGLDDNLGVAHAIQRFAGEASLADGDTLSYTMVSYEGPYGDASQELALSANGTNNSYFISEDEIIFEGYRDEPSFLCQAPW